LIGSTEHARLGGSLALPAALRDVALHDSLGQPVKDDMVHFTIANLAFNP
jgi:hypothetical protein